MGLHEVQRRTNLKQCWVAVGVVVVVTVLLESGGNQVREALAYDRDAVQAGQLWRLLTGHFVHLGWTHLALNLAGLALVAWMVGHAFGWSRWVLITLASIVAIDAGFWFRDLQLDWYVGLSGLLNGILAAGLLVGIARRERESMVLAVLVVAKLGWEQITGGPLPGSESTAGGVVVVNAHFYGAIGGLLAALPSWRSVRSGTPI